MTSQTKKLPPGQRAIKAILRWGTDHPGITYEIPNIKPEAYSLSIEGEVENPLKLSWNDILQLPSVESTSDFHCVEGWTVLDCHWKGVLFKTMAERVKPNEKAKYVLFQCADEYTTSLDLSDLMGDDIILAYQLNGEPLARELGGPLRLLVPSKYAYKSPMWVTKIQFQASKVRGFWEARGYSDTADVWKNDRMGSHWRFW